MLSSAELQYTKLIDLIRTQGTISTPTKGPCLSIFGYTIIVQPDEVPLLQGRKIYYEGLVGELKAFVADETTVEGFEKHGCPFWGAWANDDGSLDVDYARLLHNFNGINQLRDLMYNLKKFPDSRKHIISLWDPSSKAKQVPCVLSYQWNVENGKLNMIWTQRSADVMVGLASDMFSAWLLNQVIAVSSDLEPGTVTMNIGDAHIYEAHLDKVQEYLDSVWSTDPMRVQYVLDGNLWDFDLKILNYRPETKIKFELLV